MFMCLTPEALIKLHWYREKSHSLLPKWLTIGCSKSMFLTALIGFGFEAPGLEAPALSYEFPCMDR